MRSRKNATARPALGAPFFVAGALKILYDGLIYLAFRNVHPPEETEMRQRRRDAHAARQTEPRRT